MDLITRIASQYIAATETKSIDWDKGWKVVSKGRPIIRKVSVIVYGNLKKVPRLDKLFWGYKTTDEVKGTALTEEILKSYGAALVGLTLILDTAVKSRTALGYTQAEAERSLKRESDLVEECSDRLQEMTGTFKKDGGKYLSSTLTRFAEQVLQAFSEVNAVCPPEKDMWTLGIEVAIHKGWLPAPPKA